MSTRIMTFVFAVLSSSLWIAAANGTLIDVRFGDAGTFSGAAAIGAPGDLWNSLSTATVNNTTGNALTDSTGAGTGVTLDLSSVGVGVLIGYGGPFDAGPYQNLFGVQTAALSGSPISVVLHNLTPGTYDLYVISATNYPTFGQSRALAVTANGIGPTTIGPNSGATTLVENVNWLHLQPVVAGDGLLTITGALGGGDEGDLNGFQLAPVPEPSGLVLISVAALGFVAKLRRRRS